MQNYCPIKWSFQSISPKADRARQADKMKTNRTGGKAISRQIQTEAGGKRQTHSLLPIKDRVSGLCITQELNLARTLNKMATVVNGD